MKTWKNLKGWFDYENIYFRAVADAPNNAIFVEIGIYEGKSTMYMCEKIKNLNRSITFYAIDSFVGESSQEDEENKTLFERFKDNIQQCGLHNFILIAEDSTKAYQYFEYNTIDFLFIDGGHGFEQCKMDIINFLPKMKDGSTMAGHDYKSSEYVRNDVMEQFERYEVIGNSWLTKIRK